MSPERLDARSQRLHQSVAQVPDLHGQRLGPHHQDEDDDRDDEHHQAQQRRPAVRQVAARRCQRQDAEDRQAEADEDAPQADRGDSRRGDRPGDLVGGEHRVLHGQAEGPARGHAVADGEGGLVQLLGPPVLQARRGRHEGESVGHEVDHDGDADDDHRADAHVLQGDERVLVAPDLRDDLPEDQDDHGEADHAEDDRLLLVQLRRDGRRDWDFRLRHGAEPATSARQGGHLQEPKRHWAGFDHAAGSHLVRLHHLRARRRHPAHRR